MTELLTGRRSLSPLSDGSRIRRVCLGLFAAFLFSACSTPRAVLDRTFAEEILWPGPPNPPVISYLWSLHELTEKEKGGGVKDWLFGEGDWPSSDLHEADRLVRPFAVCVADGRLYLTDTGAGRVTVIGMADGSVLNFYRTGDEDELRMPTGIAVDPNGRVFVADSVRGRIFVFDGEGTYLSRFPQEMVRPTGLALDPERDRLYAADTGMHVVYVYNTAGELQATLGGRGAAEGQFNFPTHLFLDSQGRLYVTDALNFRVQVFGPDGRFQASLGHLGDRYGDLEKPKGVAVDREGHIYVVDSIQDTVKIFDREGRLLLFFGEKGTRPGQFWLPTGIFIDPDNVIYVADTYNGRVSAFRFLASPDSSSP